MQTFGCRVIQKALERVDISKALEFISEFEDTKCLQHCIEDSNGNHVIQKCIQVVCKASRRGATAAAPRRSKKIGIDVDPNELESRLGFIVDFARRRVLTLACHPYGVRVIQSIFENCCVTHKNSILTEIWKGFVTLIPDCYGNYLIQAILEHGTSSDRSLIVKEVLEHIFDYSLQKYSSNVVEKCLLFGDKSGKDAIIWKIVNLMSQPVPLSHSLARPGEDKSPNSLDALLKDQYANYVIQRVIDLCDERQFATIQKYVKDNSAYLKKYGYGKHIISLLEKRIKEKI
jgi:pumilio RNA-binding family